MGLRRGRGAGTSAAATTPRGVTRRPPAARVAVREYGLGIPGAMPVGMSPVRERPNLGLAGAGPRKTVTSVTEVTLLFRPMVDPKEEGISKCRSSRCRI